MMLARFLGAVSAIIVMVPLNKQIKGTQHKKDEIWQTRFFAHYKHYDVIMSIIYYKIFLCDIT